MYSEGKKKQVQNPVPPYENNCGKLVLFASFPSTRKAAINKINSPLCHALTAHINIFNQIYKTSMIFFFVQRLHVASFTPIFCSLISFACQLFLSVLFPLLSLLSPRLLSFSLSPSSSCLGSETAKTSLKPL